MEDDERIRIYDDLYELKAEAQAIVSQLDALIESIENIQASVRGSEEISGAPGQQHHGDCAPAN